MKPKVEKPLRSELSLKAFAEANGLFYNEEQAEVVLRAVEYLRSTREQTIEFYGDRIDGYTRRSIQTIIAGGAVSRIFRSPTEVPGDIDIYSDRCNLLMNRFVNSMPAHTLEFHNSHTGPYTFSVYVFGTKYNFIRGITSGCPEIILSTFDFNLVRLAIDVEDGSLYYVPEAIEDLKSGTLTFANTQWGDINRSSFPSIVEARLDKYAKMGYYLSFDLAMDDIPLASVGDKVAKTTPNAEDLEEFMYSALPFLHAYIEEIKTELANPTPPTLATRPYAAVQGRGLHGFTPDFVWGHTHVPGTPVVATDTTAPVDYTYTTYLARNDTLYDATQIRGYFTDTGLRNNIPEN